MESAVTWEDLPVPGRHLVAEICAAIDGVDVLIAEVSSLNENVLFELGYAIGRGKHTVPALDETLTTATRSWKSLGLLSQMGRIDYSGDASKLAALFLASRPRVGEPTHLDRLLADAKTKKPNSLFAPQPAVPTTAFSNLKKMLDRDRGWTLRGSSEDLVLAPLKFYVEEIYRSTAAIIPFLDPDRNRAEEHNSRASLLAGIAHGLDVPLLLVAEPTYQTPLDYSDMLLNFQSSSDLQGRVRIWLDERHLQATTTGRRAGRLALQVELPIRSFGQYVAEYERDSLADYFVPTSEYETMLRGDAKIFVGRKGTGKTATMQRLVDDLRSSGKNLVVSIKPASYEISGLVEAIGSVDSEAVTDYMLLSLWSYLVYTEIAMQIVRHADSRPAGWPLDEDIERVRKELENLGVEVDADLSSRLEHAVNDFITPQKTHTRRPDDREAVAKAFKVEHVRRLVAAMQPNLASYDRVAVLFDNLDKAWQRGINYAAMSRFLLALLVASGKIERELRRSSDHPAGPVFTLAVFLRTDIFDIVTRFAREPDKIETLEVRWSDEELLLRVLEERYGALRDDDHSGVEADMWAEIFETEVRSTQTRDYIPWRVLPRPRDLVYFANAALTSAINNKHDLVRETDLIAAEQPYSEFVVEALLVEGQAEEFDLEAVIYEFVGKPATLDQTEIIALLSPHGDANDIRDFLVRSTFLQIEMSEGTFEHVDGAARARRRLKIAEQGAANDGRPLHFRVHPAYRPFLEIPDTDLHIK